MVLVWTLLTLASPTLHDYPILIGQGTPITLSPLMPTSSTLATTLYPGLLRRKKALWGPLQKQNIELLPTLLLSCVGYAHSSLILVYHCRQSLLCTTIMLARLICQQTPSSTRAWSILPLTTISSVTMFSLASSASATSQQRTNLLMLSPSLSHEQDSVSYLLRLESHTCLHLEGACKR